MASSSPPARAAHDRAVNQNVVHIKESMTDYPAGTSTKDILEEEKGDALVLSAAVRRWTVVHWGDEVQGFFSGPSSWSVFQSRLAIHSPCRHTLQVCTTVENE